MTLPWLTPRRTGHARSRFAGEKTGLPARHGVGSGEDGAVRRVRQPRAANVERAVSAAHRARAAWSPALEVSHFCGAGQHHIATVPHVPNAGRPRVESLVHLKRVLWCKRMGSRVATHN